MFNRPNRNDVDDGVQDIQNDVNQLADSLESVLKSWGSDAKPRVMPLAARILLFVKDPGVAWVQQLR